MWWNNLVQFVNVYYNLPATINLLCFNINPLKHCIFQRCFFSVHMFDTIEDFKLHKLSIAIFLVLTPYLCVKNINVRAARLTKVVSYD